MLGEGETKVALKEKYDAFITRATNGEACQQQIEYVATNMLNASNSQETLQDDVAASIVETTEPKFNPEESSESVNMDSRAYYLTEEDRQSIGDNLSRVLDFNKRMEEAHRKVHPNNNVSDKVFYSFDKGIVINLDESLRESNLGLDIISLEKELSQFNVIHSFEWKKDLTNALKEERKRFKEEMKKLEHMAFDFKNLDDMSKMFVVTEMDSNTFMYGHLEVLVDSIMDMVNKPLEAGGVQGDIKVQN